MPERPAPHVLIHAGFHKTGTSSLQDFLRLNADSLRDHFLYYGKADFRSAGSHARIYGQKRFPWRLLQFRLAFRQFLQTVPDGHNLVLSRETFAGAMPGHRLSGGGLVGAYPVTAIPLGKVLVSELTRRFGPDVRITYLLTTRQKDDWLRSVHGHLLRSIRLTDDLASFRAQFAALPDLETQARQIAQALAPVQVETAALEDYTLARIGPARAVLDLMGVPKAVRTTLPPAPRANVGQPVDLRTTFLNLNREIRNKAALKARKEGLLRAHTKGLADV